MIKEKKKVIDSSGERIDQIGFGTLKIIQMPKDFCYGIDAVILADFATKIAAGNGPRQRCRVNRVIDLGTGNGIVPLILSHKTDILEIYGLEIQEASVDRGKRSIGLNGLNERVKIIHGDVSKVVEEDNRKLKGTFDMVVKIGRAHV